MVPERRLLNGEEKEAHSRIMQMGQEADKAIERALQCLREHDTELAKNIVANDESINELQYQAEEGCIVAIARQQPVAGDLRDLVSCMNIATELERIADHAADIANIVLQTTSDLQPDLAESIDQMGQKCRTMLRGVLSSYENHDEQQARQVAAEDDEVDRMEQEILAGIFACMRESEENLPPCTRSMWVVHHIERIGDRVTNIAERVVYMATGKHVDLNR
jgi:phosphate transport system protein